MRRPDKKKGAKATDPLEKVGGVDLAGLAAAVSAEAHALEALVRARTRVSGGGYPRPDLKAPRSPNVIGVLGPRGSGKTHALSRWAESLPAESSFVPLDPLDCSLSPEGQSLTLTVVYGIRARLARVRAALHRAPPPDATHRAQELFDRVCLGVLSSDEAARSVLAASCTTAGQYAEAAGRLVERRLSLPSDVTAWLDAEVACFAHERPGLVGFVVPVDDVDLVPPRNERDFVHALLDELHQDRLLFLLSADPSLLVENLARHRAPPDRELDLELARALLYKLVPGTRRVYARSWPVEGRLSFVAHGEPAGARTLGELMRLDSEARRPAVVGAARDHLARLLPGWARGLQDVYQLFRDREARDRIAAEELLPFLAEARGEPELAQALRVREPRRWSAFFDWDEQDVLGPSWAALAARARDDREDLPELRSSPASGEASSDPTRLLRAPVWTEVLLDVAFDARSTSPHWWVNAYFPVGRRLREARWSLALPIRAWDQLFEDQDPHALAWLHWAQPVGEVRPQAESIVTNVGWQPFADFLLGARVLLPDAILEAGLGAIQPLREAEERLPADRRTGGVASTKPIRVLPRRVRALLILADTLGAVPWKEMAAAARTSRPLRYFARLAAGVSWAALVRAIGTEHLAFTTPELPFVNDLRGPRALELMSWDEDELDRALARLPTEPPELRTTPGIGSRELYHCLVDLMGHPAFLATTRG